MTRALLLFTLAAVLEIGGCFAFWMWLRRDATPLWLLAGTLSLIGFAMMLAHVPTAFAGRAFAAYGGVYIVMSLAWLWGIEGERPTTADSAGAAIALIGALVIVAFGSTGR